MKNNSLVRSVLILAVTAGAMSAGGHTTIADGCNITDGRNIAAAVSGHINAGNGTAVPGDSDVFRPIHNDVFGIRPTGSLSTVRVVEYSVLPTRRPVVSATIGMASAIVERLNIATTRL